MDQDATWYRGIGLGPGHIVLDGDPATLTPPKKGDTAAQFLDHVYFGQTAGWIKMPLGRVVGLGPGDIVLDTHPVPRPKKGYISPPLFGKCILWPDGSMDQDATWYVGRLGPGHIVLDGDTAPAQKGGTAPASFWPTSVVAKRLDGSRRHLVRR